MGLRKDPNPGGAAKGAGRADSFGAEARETALVLGWSPTQSLRLPRLTWARDGCILPLAAHEFHVVYGQVLLFSQRARPGTIQTNNHWGFPCFGHVATVLSSVRGSLWLGFG